MKLLLSAVVCATLVYSCSIPQKAPYFFEAEVVLAPIDTIHFYGNDIFGPDSAHIRRISWHATSDSISVHNMKFDSSILGITGVSLPHNGMSENEMRILFTFFSRVHNIPIGTYDLRDSQQPLYLITYYEHDSISGAERRFSLGKDYGAHGIVNITTNTGGCIGGTVHASGLTIKNQYLSVDGSFNAPIK